MDIAFPTRKMQRLCSSEKRMVQELGPKMAERLRARLQQLEGALNLTELWLVPGARCHELIRDRRGQISLDLVHPLRLIIVPDHDPVPRHPEGGMDRGKITKVLVLEIADTH